MTRLSDRRRRDGRHHARRFAISLRLSARRADQHRRPRSAAEFRPVSLRRPDAAAAGRQRRGLRRPRHGPPRAEAHRTADGRSGGQHHDLGHAHAFRPDDVDMLAARPIPIVPKADPRYVDHLEDGIVEAAVQAYRNARPAEVGLAIADGSCVGTNRHDPAGPSDPEVPVLAGARPRQANISGGDARLLACIRRSCTRIRRSSAATFPP